MPDGAAADEPGIVTRKLDSQRIDLVVPAGHRLARRRGVRLAEAAAEEFIGMPPGHGLRTISDELCRAAGFEPRIAFEGEETATCRGLVGAGLGVALLPALAAIDADPEVAAVRITAPRAARTVGLAWWLTGRCRPGSRLPRLRPHLPRPPAALSAPRAPHAASTCSMSHRPHSCVDDVASTTFARARPDGGRWSIDRHRGWWMAHRPPSRGAEGVARVPRGAALGSATQALYRGFTLYV